MNTLMGLAILGAILLLTRLLHRSLRAGAIRVRRLLRQRRQLPAIEADASAVPSGEPLWAALAPVLRASIRRQGVRALRPADAPDCLAEALASLERRAEIARSSDGVSAPSPRHS